MNEMTTNPFFETFDTPFDTIPFDRIKPEHYEPAIVEGMKRELQEIDALIANPEPPTFENTLVAMQQAGRLLDTVTTVLFNLLSAETSDELQDIAVRMTPALTEHSNKISLNEALFARIRIVYDHRNERQYTAEELRLIEETYDSFVRNGVNLPEEKKKEKREISTALSTLTLRFSENLLKEGNRFEMLLREEDCLGLPQSAMDAAKAAAEEKGKEGYLITLQAPSYLPFMKFSERRDLREKLYRAYNTQCLHGDELDNRDIVKEIVNLRLRLARLLGFSTYAEMVLHHRMAETQANVDRLYEELTAAYRPVALEEMKELEDFAHRTEGADFKLRPWDFAYYSEKLRRAKYDFDSEELRPYFELSRVIDGVFGLATRLYGITFRPNDRIPVFHPEVKTYEVYDADERMLAILYTDFHPRAGKRAGAWMTSYREQWTDETGNHRPHVSVTMNFTRPTREKPALLTFGELTTFLHEFGHALHQTFADTHFKALSGTNVYWDFVELPSQFMENFAYEKDFLNTFSFHYQTGEPLPEPLIQKIIDAQNFHAAYACMRQIELGKMDMAWYNRTTPFEGDVCQYEKAAVADVKLLEDLPDTGMSVQFGHIMSGGYAAGYYSYKWAEVLEADAFSVFKEKGIFDTATARSFRENILSKGGTEPPMTLYKRFRGQEPTIEALLKRNGIR